MNLNLRLCYSSSLFVSRRLSYFVLFHVGVFNASPFTSRLSSLISSPFFSFYFTYILLLYSSSSFSFTPIPSALCLPSLLSFAVTCSFVFLLYLLRYFGVTMMCGRERKREWKKTKDRREKVDERGNKDKRIWSRLLYH